MSISSLQSRISSVQREIGSLRDNVARESKAEAALFERLARAQREMTNARSTSTAGSKAREVERIQGEISRKQKRRADFEGRVADKTKELHRIDQDLRKAQDRDQKRFREKIERQNSERRFQEWQAVQSELAPARSPTALQRSSASTQPEYDAFISHATEDKDFVGPLADALTKAGLKVWYDEFELKWGDPLRRSIDEGLARSRFGIVVLSPSFFAKGWPQYELDGLVTREINDQQKVIMPIWHKVSKDEVIQYSPSLADKVALRTADLTIAEIAERFSEAIGQ